MDRILPAVLAHYPPLLGTGQIEPLGNRGGFSGALLWRIHTSCGLLCLRAAAPTESLAHLRFRHALMRRARTAGLTFVPAVLDARGQQTVVSLAGRHWELLEWLPGTADFRAHPSRERLQRAVEAVARIHGAWEGSRTDGPCPAVLRRLEAVRQWRTTLAGQPTPSGPPTCRNVLERAMRCLDRWMPRVPIALPTAPTVRLQPCLRDVWHDHLLFTGERLTGLVDYAAVEVDSIATDLARLLGSLIEDDEEAWATGLEGYRIWMSLDAAEEDLARTLDRTGLIVAVFHWVQRLTAIAKGQADDAARARLEHLLRRVERW